MAVALLSSGVRHRMLEVVLTMVKYGAQGILQPMTFEFGQPRVVHPASASGVVYGRKKHRRGDHLEYNGAVLHIDSTVSFESVIYHYFDVQQHARC